MGKKVKNIITSLLFLLVIIGIFVINLIKKDVNISISERRKLASFPKVSFENIKNGNFSEEFENYAMDNFVFRDKFRSLKTYMELKGFGKNDNNSLYIMDDSIVKIQNQNDASIENAIQKINTIYDNYLDGMNTYISVIPDKSYYVSKQNGYPYINYEEIKSKIKEEVPSINYIDISNILNFHSFYKTDLHWKQEKLESIAEKVLKEMNIEIDVSEEYEIYEIDNFYGAYYGQLAYNLEPDTLKYLSNSIIENCEVYNYEKRKMGKVYDLEKVDSLDKYDIFLSGATPLLKITNNKSNSNKELIIFRDSFGSSIAPLFVNEYKNITLIDIRYMRARDLEKYIDFNNQDVLFLYSTEILNNSYSLRY